MEPQKQPSLRHINSKHLLDVRSDQVYTPFREITQKVAAQRYLIPQEQYNQLAKIEDRSLLPKNLQGLQITNEPVNPLKKFKKIAERQKQHQPIQEGVLRKILEKNKGPETTVYKYTELQEKNDKLKIVPITKIAQNQSHFAQNFNEKLEIVGKMNQKEHSYNLFSFLDEPLYHLRKKL